MAETAAASSPAQEADVFGGQQPSLAEFSHYRQTGEVPPRFKAAATTDAPEKTVDEPAGEEPETDSESETEVEVQEPPQKGSEAEKRIKQLLAETKELKRRLEAIKPPEPAQQVPPPQVAVQQATRPKPTPEGKGPDGNPYKTYEDYVEDMTKWNAEQLFEGYKRQEFERQARQALQVKFDDARSRYEDADAVIVPTAQKISEARIPDAIKSVIGDSDYFPDLCYVIGSDPEELTKFMNLSRTNPRAALARVFEYERAIKEELGKGKESGGQAPEKKPTSAPKPPSPVSGATSRGFDVSDMSLSADEWARKRNAQIEKRKHG